MATKLQDRPAGNQIFIPDLYPDRRTVTGTRGLNSRGKGSQKAKVAPSSHPRIGRPSRPRFSGNRPRGTLRRSGARQKSDFVRRNEFRDFLGPRVSIDPKHDPSPYSSRNPNPRKARAQKGENRFRATCCALPLFALDKVLPSPLQ